MPVSKITLSQDTQCGSFRGHSAASGDREVIPYAYSACAHDYLTGPALAQELGAFAKFPLFDLTVMGADGTLALLEQVLKYSRKRDFLQLLKELLEGYKYSLLSLER